MLKLRTITTFTAVISLALADGSEGDFKAEFKYLTRQQLDELLAENLSDSDFVERVLVSTNGITNESGAELDLPTALAAIKADIALTTATARGFLAALGGAPAKNSKTSRGR